MFSIYWIHNKNEKNLLTEGYVGITGKKPEKRLTDHKKSGRWNPDEDVFIILYEVATEEQAKQIEATLRPTPYIGRNIAPGGGGGVRNETDWKQVWEERRKKYGQSGSSVSRSASTKEGWKNRKEKYGSSGGNDSKERTEKLSRTLEELWTTEEFRQNHKEGWEKWRQR